MAASVAQIISNVDRTHEVKGLAPPEIRKSRIRLYQTYISEWGTVEPQISRDFLNQVIDQQVSQDVQMVIQPGSKGNAMATNILDNIDLRKLGQLLQQGRKP